MNSMNIHSQVPNIRRDKLVQIFERKDGVKVLAVRVTDICSGDSVIQLNIEQNNELSDRIIVRKTHLHDILHLNGKSEIFTPFDITYLINALTVNLKAIPEIFYSSSLGWVRKNGGIYFNGAEIIEISRTAKIFQPSLKSKGSFEISRDIFQKYLKGNIAAEIPIAASFAAPIIGLLEKDNILINLFGNSSIGKSSVADYCTSLWTIPSDHRLFTTWNATEKALNAFAGGKDGLMIVIDDTSSGRFKDYKELIMYLFDGEERKTMGNYGNSPNEQQKTHYSILFTAESSMLPENVKKDELGEFRRLIELHIGKGDLTRSAEDSEVVTRLCREHYGLAGIRWVNHLLLGELSKEFLKEELQREVIAVREKIGEDPILDGLASRIAIIHMTSKLVNKHLEWGFSCEEMVDFLIANCSEIVEDARNCINDNNSINRLASQIVGIAESKYGYKVQSGYMNIRTEIFNSIAELFSYRRLLLLRKLKDAGFLRYNSGRYDYKMKNVYGETNRFISIKVAEEGNLL